MIPTIVVVAYNRPKSLQRLLHSLQSATYPSGEPVRLVISIDGGGSCGEEVQHVAKTAVWDHGYKEIISHERNLGLTTHLFSCGDLSRLYGRIILLEDDLYVSPSFFFFAQQALEHSAVDEKIAGVSLSSLWFNGFNHYPFTPVLDGSDGFYMQVAWFQGQAYTAEQWNAFRAWFAQNDRPVRLEDGLHQSFTQFSDTDWFPRKTRYLADTDRFYLFPRHSFSLNFGEVGTHFSKPTSFFQVPLQEQKRSFQFEELGRSTAVYDSYQELLPRCVKELAPHIADYEFVTDFYGERDVRHVNAPYLLTTQPTHRAIRSYGLVMRPAVANIAHQIEGDGIVLTAVDDLDSAWRPRWRSMWQRHAYYTRYRPMSRRQKLKLWLARQLAR